MIKRAVAAVIVAACVGIEVRRALHQRNLASALKYKFCIWYLLDTDHDMNKLIQDLASDHQMGALGAAPAHVTYRTGYETPEAAFQTIESERLPQTLAFTFRSWTPPLSPLWRLSAPWDALNAVFWLVQPKQQYPHFPLSAHVSSVYSINSLGIWRLWLVWEKARKEHKAAFMSSFNGTCVVADVSDPDPTRWSIVEQPNGSMGGRTG